MTSFNGLSFIGAARGQETGDTFNAVNPATGETLAPYFHGATAEEVARACEIAWQAFLEYRLLPDSERATFLRTIADEIEAIGEPLVERGVAETGLPAARFQAERGRTCGQLRLFADLLDDGDWVMARVDQAIPDRKPLPKPDLRCQQRGIGPVVVFGASNFPLAFSVAGGDTASALAAGCPVIVKAHHAHPGVAELVAGAVRKAAEKCGLPEGVFSMLFGSGRVVGKALVEHPRIKAVGFTGSRAGGCSLMEVAAARPEPIPVYAEMSSINPVVILPGALSERASAIAEGLSGSVTLGVGQFCTNPGLVFLPAGEAADAFAEKLGAELAKTPACPMLTKGIREAYAEGVSHKEANAAVEKVYGSDADTGPGESHAGPQLFKTTAEAFTMDPEMLEEVFGPSTLLVTWENEDQLFAAVESLEGQLTATLHGNEEDWSTAAPLVSALELKAGRLVFNAFPTGVEVCHSIVHGGPFPATADGRSTSVGTLAIYRFTRPVAWQDCPEDLLPQALR
ncbi:MAG: aldehyde dehydrogenase (NADP(+)) [Verrucomicrobiota bacterium]